MALIELAIAFILLAIVAGVFGQRGVAGVSMRAAKWLIIVFVILAILSMVL